MAWEEVPIESWSQLTEMFEQMDYGRPSSFTFLFRGQSKAEWRLVDTLSRLLITSGTSNVDAFWSTYIEQEAYRKFVAQAHHFLDPSTLPDEKSLLAWWALMQHFGAPTRLLDWTASPYIAAYFAVVDNPGDPGAIWAFDASVVMAADTDPSVREVHESFQSDRDSQRIFWERTTPEMIYPYNLKKHHIRVTTQQGFFTVCGSIPSDHGRSIDRVLGDDSRGFCHQFVIPPALKVGILRNLMRMNITANSLFPGLDGLGKSIKEFAQIEASYQ